MSDKDNSLGLDDFGEDPLTKPEFLRKKTGPRPMPWLTWDNPKVNPMWLAEYMHQHDLSLEVAMEHWAVHMGRFIKQLTKTVELVESSDDKTVNAIKVFVKDHKQVDGFYGEMPLVNVLVKGSECPVPLKKSLLPGSKNSSET